MDYHLRVAHDTAWLEGVASRDIQGTTSPPGDVGVNSSPGNAAFAYPVFPGVKAKHVGRGRAMSVQGSMAPLSSSSLLPWQDGFRKKPLAYKSMFFFFF